MTMQNLGNVKVYTTLDLAVKNEFFRKHFELKNVSSIFQIYKDDILRPYIGKIAYYYKEDVLIYSSAPEEHIEHA